MIFDLKKMLPKIFVIVALALSFAFSFQHQRFFYRVYLPIFCVIIIGVASFYVIRGILLHKKTLKTIQIIDEILVMDEKNKQWIPDPHHIMLVKQLSFISSKIGKLLLLSDVNEHKKHQSHFNNVKEVYHKLLSRRPVNEDELVSVKKYLIEYKKIPVFYLL